MMNLGDLLPFQALVHRRSGLQLETMAESCLMLAVQKRMGATKANQSSAYYAQLLGDNAEFDELLSLLTINETYFYREQKQLELLTELIIPTLLAKTDGQPLRILSAGCSTGEEPYSIAIALREKFGESASRLVSIAAGDIDQHALQRARQGHYSEYSFRAMPQNLRERYFTRVPNQGYRLDDAIRSMVDFHSLNLLANPLPEQLADFDVVFFRNVSIYFDAPSRSRILHALHGVMRETGYLILGSAETLANDLGVFQLRENGRGFYFVKGEAPLPPKPLTKQLFRPSQAQPAKKSAPRTAAKPHRPSLPMTPEVSAVEQLDAIREKILARRYSTALEQLAPLLRAAPDQVDVQLLQGYALLQSRCFADAAVVARQLLEHDHWSVDAMMLLGLAAKWQDDSAAAIDHFKSAAYTRPDCWPAHFYLAGLWHQAQPTRARREYRTTLLQLAANPDPNGGLRLPLDLPVADIRFLCEQRSGVESMTNEPRTHRGA